MVNILGHYKELMNIFICRHISCHKCPIACDGDLSNLDACARAQYNRLNDAAKADACERLEWLKEIVG